MVLIAVHGSASRLLPAERGTVRLALELEDADRAVVLGGVGAMHARFAAEAEALVAAGAATWWGSQQARIRSEHRYEGRDELPRVVQIANAEVVTRFRDFESLSAWVLEAGAEPGVRVDAIEWAVTDEHRVATERELRVQAVQDAIARAEAYASAIGGERVRLRSLWEAGLRADTGGGEPRWVAQAMDASMARSGIELRPDDIALSASVTADFELEPPS
ncbi:SIMPL domain-containing protein [uncultured Amnibacterium sp.]|uniref:SIMPL domain-containing protein n=1 Tax=uncultured Amnibacterium sp. TaxID=1631851 RepID=UPI0035C954E1